MQGMWSSGCCQCKLCKLCGLSYHACCAGVNVYTSGLGSVTIVKGMYVLM